MPNLLDHRDAKNIIIWLLGAFIGLCIYVYKEDQKKLDQNHKIVNQQIVEFKQALKEDLSAIKDDQKEMREEQKALMKDVAEIKGSRKTP